jgi:hypothetical protein
MILTTVQLSTLEALRWVYYGMMFFELFTVFVAWCLKFSFLTALVLAVKRLQRLKTVVVFL